MIDTHGRKTIQPVFDRMSKYLARYKVSPNIITAAALVIGIISAVFLAKGFMIAALVCLWLSGILDVLDGSLARYTKQASPFGAYMDLVFDRVVEGVIVLGFYLAMPDLVLPAFGFYIAAMFNFTTFMLAGTLFVNTGLKSIHYDVGIAERTETFIVYSLMMLIPSFSGVILWLFNGIMLLTGILRFHRIYRYLKERQGDRR